MKNKFDIKILENIFSENFNSPIYSILVEEYLSIGDLDRANTVCNIGVENNPDDLAGKYLMAKINFFQNNISQSKKILNEILEEFPIHLNARQLMIKILKEDKNEVDLLNHIEKLQQYHPSIGSIDSKDSNVKDSSENLNSPVNDPLPSTDDEQNSEKPKESFTVKKNMATFTFVDILIAQKHFSEALEILDILEKEGKQKKKIKEKRDYIKNRI
ncbi:MAG: hypothetical protein CMG11_01230 [Candidatus Marinimicrobia bacterium]|jgi:tetratricopeptide (TPR) repeat protein|nr:hypothetical protein [Candidatus Neomarinimicrobiota bacterium]|tara:strand:- start:1131 stop:1775 length:645 start_codon:yes stop_codon:yes gene_type:complete